MYAVIEAHHLANQFLPTRISQRDPLRHYFALVDDESALWGDYPYYTHRDWRYTVHGEFETYEQAERLIREIAGVDGPEPYRKLNAPLLLDTICSYEVVPGDVTPEDMADLMHAEARAYIEARMSDDDIREWAEECAGGWPELYAIEAVPEEVEELIDRGIRRRTELAAEASK